VNQRVSGVCGEKALPFCWRWRSGTEIIRATARSEAGARKTWRQVVFGPPERDLAPAVVFGFQCFPAFSFVLGRIQREGGRHPRRAVCSARRSSPRNAGRVKKVSGPLLLPRSIRRGIRGASRKIAQTLGARGRRYVFLEVMSWPRDAQILAEPCEHHRQDYFPETMY